MSRQRIRDTAPEVALRRELHRRGLRYRVEFPLPIPRRRADIAFPKRRVAIFVDGCFWHGCPVHVTSPKTNGDWWTKKLAANKCRDEDTNARLEAAGWVVVRMWEHEDPRIAAKLISTVVRGRG